MSDSSGVKYMILGNGVQAYKTTDAISFTDVTGDPLGKYYATLYQRVYAAGVPADPDILHWSSIGDLTNWSSVAPNDSDSTSIDKYSKGNIKGIITANDRVVIYKDRTMKTWDGEYLLTPKCSDGLCAPYSLSEILGLVFSLGTDALYLFDGTMPKPISTPIEDIVNNIDRSASNIERICGVGFKKKYCLSIGDVTDDDGTVIRNCWIVYDMFNDAFFLYSLGVQATAMCKFINTTNGSEDLYFGDSTGTVFKMFQGDQDDGDDIEMRLRSHKIYPGGTSVAKEPDMLTIVADPADGLIATLIADETRKEPVEVATKHVTNALIGKLGENNKCFELDITHVGKGRPRLYGWELTVGNLGEDRV